jgi:hypothetical protein
MALEALDKVDESLYARFVTSRTTVEDPEASASGLRSLWRETFRTPQLLLAYCRKISSKRKPTSTPVGEQPPEELELGDFESPPEQPEDSLSFELDDIGGLIEGLGTQPKRSELERWGEALEKISGIRYGLGGQYDDTTERVEVAIASGHANQVLGFLDEMTSIANEGVAALVKVVYEAFVPDADQATIVPAYKTTLKRALLVRRGLGKLVTELSPLNSILQGADNKRHPEALVAISETLHVFVESDVCRAMRAADRWELTQFDQRLELETLIEGKHTAEGLVKYLESLTVVNRREVLIEHDRRIVTQVREALANARELGELSAATAHQILVTASNDVQALLGKNPALDKLLERIKAAAPLSKPARNGVLIGWLEEVIEGAGS